MLHQQHHALYQRHVDVAVLQRHCYISTYSSQNRAASRWPLQSAKVFEQEHQNNSALCLNNNNEQ